MAPDIEHELRDWAEQRFGPIATITQLKSNNNRVYEFTLVSGAAIIAKTYGEGDDGSTLAREVSLFRCLYQSGMPVPQILAENGSRWFAMERIEGVLLEQCEEPWAWQQAGEMVARLASIDDTELLSHLVPRQRNWGLLHRRLVEHDLWRTPFSHIVESAQAFASSERSVPIHGDYGPGQIIVTEQSLVLLDLESLCLGDPLYALGRCMAMVREYSHEWHWGALTMERCLDLLIEGYHRACPLSDLDQERLVINEMMSHLWDISWKLVCEPEHRQHALQMSQRIETSWWPCHSQADGS